MTEHAHAMQAGLERAAFKINYHDYLLSFGGDESTLIELFNHHRHAWLQFVSDRQAFVVADIGATLDKRGSVTPKQRSLYLSIAYDGAVGRYTCEAKVDLSFRRKHEFETWFDDWLFESVRTVQEEGARAAQWADA